MRGLHGELSAIRKFGFQRSSKLPGLPVIRPNSRAGYHRAVARLSVNCRRCPDGQRHDELTRFAIDQGGVIAVLPQRLDRMLRDSGEGAELCGTDRSSEPANATHLRLPGHSLPINNCNCVNLDLGWNIHGMAGRVPSFRYLQMDWRRDLQVDVIKGPKGHTWVGSFPRDAKERSIEVAESLDADIGGKHRSFQSRALNLEMTGHQLTAKDRLALPARHQAVVVFGANQDSAGQKIIGARVEAELSQILCEGDADIGQGSGGKVLKLPLDVSPLDFRVEQVTGHGVEQGAHHHEDAAGFVVRAGVEFADAVGAYFHGVITSEGDFSAPLLGRHPSFFIGAVACKDGGLVRLGEVVTREGVERDLHVEGRRFGQANVGEIVGATEPVEGGSGLGGCLLAGDGGCRWSLR
jgi:hypothetical protein